MDEAKKKILQMVEDGKITADEALSLLAELEKAGKESEQKEQNLKNELSTEVIPSNKAYYKESTQDTFKKNLQSSKDLIFGFVESAIQKIKDTDLDFNFGKAVEVSHIFQSDDHQFEKVDIDIANGNVKLVAWEHHDVRIECQAKVYKVDGQNEARHKLLKEVLFDIKERKLKLNVQESEVKLETLIYIPKKQYDEVRVRLFNGPIKVDGIQAKELKGKTANGAITIGQVASETGELETGNGTIIIEQSSFNKLESETLNGAIEAQGQFNKGDFQTFNGQIICRNEATSSDSIHAKSVTGKIELFLPKGTPVSGELKSNLGGFSVNLDGIKIVEEKTDVIQKVLKFKNVLDEGSITDLFIETKTGAISIS